MSASGLVAGQRVLMVLGNRIEFVTTYLGALRAQAVAVPVNPRATAGEIARMTADSGARMVVADADTVTVVREALDLLARAVAGDASALERVDDDLLERAVTPRLVVAGATLQPGERSYDHLRADAARWVPPLTDPERLAALLYTSGTSGRPRAAMLTHRALAANIDQVAAIEPPMIHGDDVVLGVLPLFHVYGLNGVLGGVLRHRAKLVLADDFDPEGTLDLVDDLAVSVLPVAPAVFAHWRDVDLDGRLGPVRLVLCGSAPLEPEAAEAFTARTGIAVHQGYGLTEAAPVVTSTLRSEVLQSGVGGTRARRHRDPAGRRVRGTERGRRPRRDLHPGRQPVLRLLARRLRRPRRRGLVGHRRRRLPRRRRRRLPRRPGPGARHRLRLQRLPGRGRGRRARGDGVADAAVIGVADDLTGEAVVAYVVAQPATPTGSSATVREHCERRLARFKVPTRIEVVDALPLGVTGKVQKGRLRSRERRRVLGLLE